MSGNDARDTPGRHAGDRRESAPGSGSEFGSRAKSGSGSVDDHFDAVAVERAERTDREERLASRRLAGIEAGRRKGGLVGAALAGSMLVLHEIYEGPAVDVDIVEVAETPGGPGDIDIDGIDVSVDGVDIWAPPPTSSRDS